MDWTLLAALLSGAAATTLIQHLFLRRKTAAEASKVFVESELLIFDTLRGLMEPMNRELDRLRHEHEGLRGAHKACESNLVSLKERISVLEDETGARAERVSALEAENDGIKRQLLRLEKPND